MVHPDTGDREGGQHPPWGGQQEAGAGGAWGDKSPPSRSRLRGERARAVAIRKKIGFFSVQRQLGSVVCVAAITPFPNTHRHPGPARQGLPRRDGEWGATDLLQVGWRRSQQMAKRTWSGLQPGPAEPSSGEQLS